MGSLNRREFVGGAAATAGAIVLGSETEGQSRRPAKITDLVALGKTGIRTSLIGIGTGSVGSGHASNQTRLGQAKFTEMIRHAYESGIRFFDAADQYGSYPFLKEALKGLPRNKIAIQGKSNSRTPEGMKADIDRFRQELGVDYLDTLLIHCVMEPAWNVRYRGVMDVLEEARQKKLIRAHGVSCHTHEALVTAAAEPWVQVDLARFNPWGAMMDHKRGEPRENTPSLVRDVLAGMKKAGKGVIAMKILAEGQKAQGAERLANARESIRFALTSGVVDSMVIGFESPRQIDEVLGEATAALQDIARA